MSPLLSLVFILFLSPSLICAQNCNPEDQKALLSIKAHFNNQPYFSSWVPNTPCCGSWQGINGCTNSRVSGLYIKDDNLSGTIPPTVKNLLFLQSLSFENLPNLVGTIPPEIASISNLNLFAVRFTNVTGPVPSFLSKLTNLSQLELTFNKLYGPIPRSIDTNPNLFDIDFTGNNLSGTLSPNFLRNAPVTPFLRLGGNHFTGELPENFGNIKFDVIDLSNNEFSGSAALLFGRLKEVTEVNLSGNEFEFDLTNVVFPKTSLNVLNISHNRIYGSIPKSIAKVKKLSVFDVSYNRLCGEIPTGVRMRKFGAESYVHNKCLCGTPLPPTVMRTDNGRTKVNHGP